ncbi:MFS transporter small subunit [Streptomyces sp. NPDC002067]
MTNPAPVPQPDPENASTAFPRRALTVAVWLWVGLPLAYGLYELVSKATKLFTG